MQYDIVSLNTNN